MENSIKKDSIDATEKIPKPLTNLGVRFFLQSLYNCISHSENNAQLISNINPEILEKIVNKASGNFLTRNSFSTVTRWLLSVNVYVIESYYRACFVEKIELLGKYVVNLKNFPTRTFKLYAIVLDKAPPQFEKLYNSSMISITLAVPMLKSVLTFKYYKEKLADVKIGDSIVLKNVTPYPYVNRIKPFSTEIDHPNFCPSFNSNLFDFINIGLDDVKTLCSSCNFSLFTDNYSEQKQSRFIGAVRIVSGQLIGTSPTLIIKNGNEFLELYPTEKLLRSLCTDLAGIEKYEKKWVSILCIFWYRFGWNLPEYPEALALQIIEKKEAILKDAKAQLMFKSQTISLKEFQEFSSSTLKAINSDEFQIIDDCIIIEQQKNLNYPLIGDTFTGNNFSRDYERKIIKIFDTENSSKIFVKAGINQAFSFNLSLILDSYEANCDYILTILKKKIELSQNLQEISFAADLNQGFIDDFLKKNPKIMRDLRYFEYLGIVNLEKNEGKCYAYMTDLGKRIVYFVFAPKVAKIIKDFFEKFGIGSVPHAQRYLFEQNFPAPRFLVKAIFQDLEKSDFITNVRGKNDEFIHFISPHFRVNSSIESSKKMAYVDLLINYFKEISIAVLKILNNVTYGLGSAKISEEIEQKKIVNSFYGSILTEDSEIACNLLLSSGILQKNKKTWFYPYDKRVESFLKNNSMCFFKKEEISDYCTIPFFKLNYVLEHLQNSGVILNISDFYSITLDTKMLKIKIEKFFEEEAKNEILSLLRNKGNATKQDIINFVTPNIFRFAREFETSISSLIIVDKTIKSLIKENRIINKSGILIFNKQGMEKR